MDEENQVFQQGDSAALLVIEFPSFRDFIDAYSPIISEEGIFIRNADVAESNAFSVGDRVDFEVRLKDDFRLIQGAGEVVWLGSSEAADGASGTAIRFHDVDEPSQRLISRLVGNYVRDGGKLFEIEGDAVSASAPSAAASIAGADTEPLTTPEPEEPAVTAAADAESLTTPGPEGPAVVDVPSAEPELTAEHLEASEADELFADEDDEPVAALEFESVSLEDVERRKPEAEPPSLALEDPVGLDTIAIPSGLLASLASEGAAAPQSAVKADGGAKEESGTAADVAQMSDQVALDPAEAVIAPSAPSALEDNLLDGEASFSGVSEPLDSLEPALEKDIDRGSLGAGVGIPDDIAQVAEELSGVHRFELPEPEEVSGIDYAGSASVRSERNTGGRIAALSVVWVLLGAGAFYFGDTILATLGWGTADSGSVEDQVIRAGEAMPPAATAKPADSAGVEVSASLPTPPQPSDQGGQDTNAANDAEATAEMPEDSPSFEPVQVTVERDEDAVAGGRVAETGNAASADATASAGSTQEPAPAPAATVASVRVERITWQEVGAETIVTIRLNAEVPKRYVEVVRVRDGAPREVIKIQGVEVPYSPRELTVGSRHVVRLRTGLHRNPSGSALHVVADLTGAAVTVLSVEPKGRDVLITFS